MPESDAPMIILDAPYASGSLVQWLAQSRRPVLANGFSPALSAGVETTLSLADDHEAVRRIDGGTVAERDWLPCTDLDEFTTEEPRR